MTRIYSIWLFAVQINPNEHGNRILATVDCLCNFTGQSAGAPRAFPLCIREIEPKDEGEEPQRPSRHFGRRSPELLGFTFCACLFTFRIPLDCHPPWTGMLSIRRILWPTDLSVILIWTDA